jgi:hypothetical protein
MFLGAWTTKSAGILLIDLREQTCAESQFFKEKSSQVIQKSSHDLDFFGILKKVKVMTLT